MLRLLLILPEGRIEGRARAALAHQFLGVCVQFGTVSHPLALYAAITKFFRKKNDAKKVSSCMLSACLL